MKKGIILLFCIVVGLLAGCSKEPSVSHSVAFDNTNGLVRVMTFNIRYGTAGDGENSWPYRKEALFGQIAELAPDVAGLQEVLSFQKEEILRALPEYGAVGIGRDDGKEDGEQCCILYRKDRFDVADSGTFWFSDTPEVVGSKHWGNTLPRICTWIRLVEKNSGKGFYLYNVHIDHQSEVSRVKSTELLAQRIAQRALKEPVVVVGDFNCVPDSPPLAYLLGTSEKKPPLMLIDALALVRPEQKDMGTFHGFSGKTDGKRIDMILTEPEIRVEDAGTDTAMRSGRCTSDHFPVTVRLRLF